MEKKDFGSLTILGSTGSVGEQAVDVALAHAIPVNALSANRNAKRVEEQARQLSVKACAMADETAARDLKERLADTDIKVYSGASGIEEMLSLDFGPNETVVNSILGESRNPNVFNFWSLRSI